MKSFRKHRREHKLKSVTIKRSKRKIFPEEMENVLDMGKYGIYRWFNRLQVKWREKSKLNTVVITFKFLIFFCPPFPCFWLFCEHQFYSYWKIFLKLIAFCPLNYPFTCMLLLLLVINGWDYSDFVLSKFAHLTYDFHSLALLFMAEKWPVVYFSTLMT